MSYNPDAAFDECTEQLEKLRAEMQCELEQAYRKGWERGVWLYAVWRDGSQVVGISEEPLETVRKRGPDTAWMRADLEL